MKIRDIHLHLLEAKLTKAFSYSRAWYDTRMALLVEIVTDDGIVGWGEAYGPQRMLHGVIANLKPLLLGQDPLRSEFLWQEVYSRLRDHGQKGLLIQALSAVDIALWDIKGKYLKQPIHRLMGGPLRSEIVAYATGLYRLRDGNPDKYLVEEAEGYAAQGFSAMKLKVGYGVEEDERLTRAIHKAIGPARRLMIDANHAYDSVAAIRLARRIEELDIGWFEEPVPPEDIAGYVRVRQAQSIPVAGGECEFTRFGFRELLTRGAVDIVQPDTCAAGGLSECKKIADMAHAFGVRYNPHVWGTGVAIAASLHLLAVLPDNPLSLNPIQPMLEFDRTEHPMRMTVLTQAIEHKNGLVAVPQGHGLGIEIDRAALDRFRAA
jgi:D-galactarolactone cycloisomerase